jgi:hypothetical protein
MADPVVMAAVAAQLEGFDLCDVFDQNGEGDAPSDGSEYVVIQQPVSNRDRLALNQRIYSEEGAIRFVIHTAVGTGAERANAIYAALLPRFLDRKVGRVRFWTPGAPAPDPDASDGNYYVTSFAAPYTFTFNG